MNDSSQKLRRFARRVRLVRSWRGLAIGACLGAGISAGWAALDWLNIAYTDPASMAILTGVGAVLGALIGALIPVPMKSLAASIDRRAGLADRLSTADERAQENGAFDAELREDALRTLAQVQPKAVYPIRVGRWQGGSVALAAIAAALFLLGNTPLLLSDQAKAARAAVQKEGQRVERVRKENLDEPEARGEMTEAQRRMADELRRLQRDLEKARMSPEEARQRANELGKQAQELAKQSAKETLKNLETAQQAWDKQVEQQLREAGMQDVDPQLAQLSPEERNAQLQQLQDQLAKQQQNISDLQQKLNDLSQKLTDPKLSPEDRKALEKQLAELKKALAEAEEAAKQTRQQMEALKLSAKAQEVFRKMREHPLYKELQELAKKLQQNAQQAAKTGQPSLSKAEREELLKKLEELAKKLADDKAMEEYLRAMLDAMKNTGGT